MSSDAVFVWSVSLVLGVVVIAVVAVLLELILRSARRIEDTVAAIWTAGQGVANNTIHIALLQRTNLTASRILEAAGGVLRAAAAIRNHAQHCPRCPTCAAGSGTGGW
jgi:Na+/H+ antiporter NhaC